MLEFFSWLSRTPNAEIILLMLLGLLIGLILVAFSQGREISFWPPKIGGHHKKSGTEELKKNAQRGNQTSDAGNVAVNSYLESDRPSWVDALNVAEKLLKDIEESWKPDIVIGMGRSGAIWGGWLSGNLGSLPLAVVDIKYDESLAGRTVSFPRGVAVLNSIKDTFPDRRLKVLIVEGGSSNGQTLREFRNQFASYFQIWNIRFAALYKNKVVPEQIEFVGKNELNWPKRFPWQIRPGYIPYTR